MKKQNEKLRKKYLKKHWELSKKGVIRMVIAIACALLAFLIIYASNDDIAGEMYFLGSIALFIIWIIGKSAAVTNKPPKNDADDTTLQWLKKKSVRRVLLIAAIVSFVLAFVFIVMEDSVYTARLVTFFIAVGLVILLIVGIAGTYKNRHKHKIAAKIKRMEEKCVNYHALQEEKQKIDEVQKTYAQSRS